MREAGLDAGSFDAAAESTQAGQAIQAVRQRIEDACRRVGRSPESVSLVTVSKTVPIERLRVAVEAGLTRLGENRLQEALPKMAALPGVSWDLLGPLQSNKARRAMAAFVRIQTVDSIDLVRRLDSLAAELQPTGRYPVLLQVNVDYDPAKAGFSAAALEAALPEIAQATGLELQGLMTVGRFTTDAATARGTFSGLRRVSERLRAIDAGLGPELSMGMSDDFELAIEEGATIVRIGRALFGERPAPVPIDRR